MERYASTMTCDDPRGSYRLDSNQWLSLQFNILSLKRRMTEVSAAVG